MAGKLAIAYDLRLVMIRRPLGPLERVEFNELRRRVEWAVRMSESMIGYSGRDIDVEVDNYETWERILQLTVPHMELSKSVEARIDALI